MKTDNNPIRSIEPFENSSLKVANLIVGLVAAVLILMSDYATSQSF